VRRREEAVPMRCLERYLKLLNEDTTPRIRKALDHEAICFIACQKSPRGRGEQQAWA
jgi:RecB family endonuclease NucS